MAISDSSAMGPTSDGSLTKNDSEGIFGLALEACSSFKITSGSLFRTEGTSGWTWLGSTIGTDAAGTSGWITSTGLPELK